jgi:hypothetical protein
LHNLEEKLARDIETAEASGASMARRTSWLGFLVPSVSDLVFVLLLVALTSGTLAKGLLGDAGIGWHIRTGELIRNTHEVPRVDPFSSVMQGKAWFAWEWLYDYLVGTLHMWAGLNGVVLLTGFVIALTFALVFRRMIARGAQLPVAIVILLLALAASTIHFLARPHVVSWLLAVIWFDVLERFEAEGNWRRLVWLPATMLAWVNLHGGFLVGLALLGIYFVGSAVPAWSARNVAEKAAARVRAKAIAITGVVCALFTLANPYGYQLHVHIYRYLSDRFLMDHIDEFLSPNFHGMAQKCFAVLVLLAVVGTAGARKKITLSQLLVVLFAVYTGMYASRNLPISSILLALIVAPQLSVVLKEMAGSREVSDGLRRSLARFDSFSARMAAFDARMAGRLWPGLAVVVLLWSCAHHGGIGSSHVMDARFDDQRFPVKAVDYLAGAHTGGVAAPLPTRAAGDAIFCPDRWGGYLIYRLYPGQLVAVDDRHDLYGTEFLKRYLKIVHGEPGWRDALSETRAGWVMVPAESVPAGLLASGSKWSVAYRDDVAVLLSRIK